MRSKNRVVPAASCPQCGRVLINRIVDYCQYCSAELPPELRLSDTQKDALREELRKDVEREELGRRRAGRSSPDGWSPAFTGLDGGGGDFGDGGGGDCGDGGGCGCD